MLNNKEYKPLSDILENAGFQNIADAIRKSTIVPQYVKAKGLSQQYDIRYGLNQQLARKSRYPEEFAKALAEFMDSYNAENYQLRERYGKQGRQDLVDKVRRDITNGDIDQIINLIDERQDSVLVARLLIAYGYARDDK